MLLLLRNTILLLAFLLAWAPPLANLALAQKAYCPQPRFTGKAPDDYYSRSNPLTATGDNTKAAERIFLGSVGSANCSICHGKKGDGKGILSSQYDPPPRNFSCAATIKGVPDGQLFWIIKFGSPGTAMPPHPALKDEQVWQLVLYLRTLAK